MLVSRLIVRASRKLWRSSPLLCIPQNHPFPIISNQFRSILNGSPHKLAPRHISLFQLLALNSSPLQRHGLSSSARESSDKKPSNVENSGASTSGDSKKSSSDQTEESKAANHTNESGSISDSYLTMSQTKRRRGTKRTAFFDSDSEGESAPSYDDLVDLMSEKEELLKLKLKEIETMQDKVLRSYAEMENVMDRTRREAENSKKFAIQNFARSLLDVADNLARASSVVKESYSKIDVSKDFAGAFPLLKTLLEGVEMTEKQLNEVFKKFGVEKFDPINEPFDPHRHNAAFQIPDGSKPPGTVTLVLTAGYMLHDRIIRPAEVGVTQAVKNDGTDDNPL